MASPTRRRNPITGAWEKVPSEVKVDVIEANPIPQAKKVPAIAAVAETLARMRQEYAAMGNERYGPKGQKAARAYRTKAFEFWHLTGRHPPPITADL